ncbi:hypothetical protein OIDMADRAFT_17880 [Oidiodendron maius Zn]|uniref:Uncharacterized protein n=1 Tax=Oidiodendron maius (strain Zn) TaxID=913774 RepID=A0A0C3D226_OIDMZ|nr:hypothetical protein OIDMADRAFT_17880 [Oidiodendron maius Zn]
MKLLNAAVISMASTFILGGMALPVYQITPGVAKALQDAPDLHYDTGAFGGLNQAKLFSGRPLSQRAEPNLHHDTGAFGGLDQAKFFSGRPLSQREEPSEMVRL